MLQGLIIHESGEVQVVGQVKSFDRILDVLPDLFKQLRTLEKEMQQESLKDANRSPVHQPADES